jgi:hypothetical protein
MNERKTIVTWLITLGDERPPVQGLKIDGHHYTPDEIVDALTKGTEGKSTLQTLACKAAYAVLSDSTVSREAPALSEDTREVLAQFIGKRFIALLNERRQRARATESA